MPAGNGSVQPERDPSLINTPLNGVETASESENSFAGQKGQAVSYAGGGARLPMNLPEHTVPEMCVYQVHCLIPPFLMVGGLLPSPMAPASLGEKKLAGASLHLLHSSTGFWLAWNSRRWMEATYAKGISAVGSAPHFRGAGGAAAPPHWLRVQPGEHG